MNNKVWLAFLACSFLMHPMAVLSSADDSVVESAKLPMQIPSGEIVSVNLEESYIVVQYSLEEGATTTETASFYFLPTVKIIQNGEEVAVSSLKEGDSVSIDYEIDANNNNKVINTLNLK